MCKLALWFLFLTVALADVYNPSLDSPLFLFNTSQYLVASSYTECLVPRFFPCETENTFIFASDPANKRAFFQNIVSPTAGDTQYILENGTYWVLPYNASTGQLDGPFTCFFNGDATYDSEVASYSLLTKVSGDENVSTFTGMITHGGVCAPARTAFQISINKRGYLDRMSIQTPIPFKKGTADYKLVVNIDAVFPQGHLAFPPADLLSLPSICWGDVASYCVTFDF